MANFLFRYRENYKLWPSNQAIWHRDGHPLKEGDLLVQTDLSNSIQYMVDEEAAASSKGRQAGLKAARDAFYLGDIAKKIIRFHEENGGLLTAEDLSNYSTPIEEPLSIKYRDINIYSCKPWCQGPVLLQMLRILEGFDLPKLGHNSVDYILSLIHI